MILQNDVVHVHGRGVEMRWRTGRRSRNIEDRRRIRVPRKAAGGGIGIIVIALIAMYFGVDPTVILNQQSPPTSSVSTYTASKPISPADNQLADFVSIEEALNAASAIGDDRLQRKGRGYVTPDSFTHGSSKQRVHWFKQGLETGDVLDCNTFRADNL